MRFGALFPLAKIRIWTRMSSRFARQKSTAGVRRCGALHGRVGAQAEGPPRRGGGRGREGPGAKCQNVVRTSCRMLSPRTAMFTYRSIS